MYQDQELSGNGRVCIHNSDLCYLLSQNLWLQCVLHALRTKLILVVVDERWQKKALSLLEAISVDSIRSLHSSLSIPNDSIPVNDAPRICTIRTRRSTISRSRDSRTLGVPILGRNSDPHTQHSCRPEIGYAVSIDFLPELVREQALHKTHLDCKVLMDIARPPFFVTHQEFHMLVIAGRRWPIGNLQDLIER